jgi:hypothetical protein
MVHAFSLSRPLHGIPKKRVYLLCEINLMVKRIPMHIGMLVNLILHVTILRFLKMLNYVDYLLSHWKEEGRIQAWYKAFPTESIHSWKQFKEVFLNAHDNYDYDQLCVELIKKWKMKDESFDEFLLRVVPIYDRFCESDKPSISKFITFLFLFIFFSWRGKFINE